MDPIGVLIATGAVVTFILAMQVAGQTHAQNSSRVVGLLVGFVLCFALFVGWEIYAGERAMVEARLIKLPSVWAHGANLFLIAAGFFCILDFIEVVRIDFTCPKYPL